MIEIPHIIINNKCLLLIRRGRLTNSNGLERVWKIAFYVRQLKWRFGGILLYFERNGVSEKQFNCACLKLTFSQLFEEKVLKNRPRRGNVILAVVVDFRQKVLINVPKIAGYRAAFSGHCPKLKGSVRKHGGLPTSSLTKLRRSDLVTTLNRVSGRLKTFVLNNTLDLLIRTYVAEVGGSKIES